MTTKKIEIGKEAFDLVLETGEYKDSLLSACQKYHIQYQTLRGYIREYMGRVVSPKPTASDIIKYKGIREGIISIEKALYEEPKELKSNIEASRKKVKEIIDKYIASKNIFPDSIITYYYSGSATIPAFLKALESYRKDSPSNQKDYDEFYSVMQERTDYLINKIKYLLNNYSIDKLSSFDIELETGLDSHTFANSLNKKVIMNEFGANTVNRLFNIVKRIPKSVKIYSLEDAKKLNIAISGNPISEETIEEIYAFLEEKGLKISYDNIVHCARLTPITLNESIGKEAYDLYLKENGNAHAYGDIIREHGITFKDVNKYISEYRKRKFSPKPSEEDEKAYKLYVRRDNNNFINLDDIVSSLIFAKDDKDLERTISKYKFVAIRRSVDEYLLAKDNNQSDKDLLKEKFDRLCAILNKQQTGKEKEDKLFTILNDYIDSSNVYPDSIALHHGMSPRLFEQRIEKTDINSSEQLKLYNLVRNQRINKYIERLKVLLEALNNKIDPLDAQIIMDMKMSELLICLSRKDTSEVINRDMAIKLIRYFRSISGSNKVLPLEEAEKINYSYNGTSITPSDLEVIFAYLDENHLDTTKSNIIFAFNKLVDGKIQKSIMNIN